jgi:DNA recombination protein RmuC
LIDAISELIYISDNGDKIMTSGFIETAIASVLFFIIGIIAGWYLNRLSGGARVTALESQLMGKNENIKKLENDLSIERQNITRLNREVSARETEAKVLSRQMDEQKKEIERINEKFNIEFKNIANQIIVNNSTEFNRQTSDRLKDLLSPFKEKIEKFEKKIDDTREKQLKESASLIEQINLLNSTSLTISEDAKNLTNALTNKSKIRGDWGEMILEKILENSGLIKGEHYTIQRSLRDDEQNKLQPDAVIHLPEDRHLIIDSKVSLVDYEKYFNEDNQESRDAHLKDHIKAIYGHIDNLSSKGYQKALGVNPPDFILMFLPVEHALIIALEQDRRLFQYAWEKNIALISPTTLMPTLKIIHNIWRQESQNMNAQAIAEAGGKLYDKFVGFLNDLKDIGNSIEKTKDSFDSALNKLSTGRGNIIGITEKMRELGAKASKNMPDGIDYEES